MTAARRVVTGLVPTVAALVLSAAAAASTGEVLASPPEAARDDGSDAIAKGTGFAITRHVIAGGGGASSGGAFAVSGTIGQADADPLHPATGGVFAISGGFWPGLAAAPPPGDDVFANGFEPPAP